MLVLLSFNQVTTVFREYYQNSIFLYFGEYNLLVKLLAIACYSLHSTLAKIC